MLMHGFMHARQLVPQGPDGTGDQTTPGNPWQRCRANWPIQMRMKLIWDSVLMDDHDDYIQHFQNEKQISGLICLTDVVLAMFHGMLVYL